jgi:hypothetical protein
MAKNVQKNGVWGGDEAIADVLAMQRRVVMKWNYNF